MLCCCLYQFCHDRITRQQSAQSAQSAQSSFGYAAGAAQGGGSLLGAGSPQALRVNTGGEMMTQSEARYATIAGGSPGSALPSKTSLPPTYRTQLTIAGGRPGSASPSKISLSLSLSPSLQPSVPNLLYSTYHRHNPPSLMHCLSHLTYM